ncbi:MAG: metallophosphatase family protein [Balneolales bacterium]|nr:metallophosphatase family protein [Balneolales bacterium]
MKIALISDLHGNLQATNAVMWELDSVNTDLIICLGDLIGYGPNPNEVVSVIREREIPTVLGNHDAVVGGSLTYRFFREPNRSLLQKSVDMLSEENKKWLRSLPYTIESDNWIAAHSSPINPEEWKYLNSSILCQQVLGQVKKEFVFVGHTHRQGIAANEFGVFGLRKGYKFVVNPGSIGQPRDEDKRAAFSVIDTVNFTIQNFRVYYDYTDTLREYKHLKISEKDARQLLGV